MRYYEPMKSFASSTTIQAAPEAIWRILTDAAGYPSWNTTVSRVDGLIALGERVTVHAKVAPGRAFPVKWWHSMRQNTWCGAAVCHSAC